MTLIEQLLKLHQVDSQLRGLTARVVASERHLNAQERQLAASSVRIQELRTQRQQAEARAAALEVEIASVDERATRLRADMGAAATHKQHNAILTELNALKARKTDFEARALAEMEQAEKLAAEIADVATAVEDRQKLRDHAAEELRQRRADVAERVEELKLERHAAAAALPGETLSLFDRVAGLHEGDALAPVEELSKRHREYACSACNVQLPFESVAQLTGSTNALVQCQSCERILFLHQETRGSLVG